MLNGKTALVTGSSGGIGLAMAQELAAAGSNVVLHGLEDPSVVTEQLAALRSFGVSAMYLQKDLQNP